MVESMELLKTATTWVVLFFVFISGAFSAFCQFWSLEPLCRLYGSSSIPGFTSFFLLTSASRHLRASICPVVCPANDPISVLFAFTFASFVRISWRLETIHRHTIGVFTSFMAPGLPTCANEKSGTRWASGLCRGFLPTWNHCIMFHPCRSSRKYLFLTLLLLGTLIFCLR